MRMPRLEMTRLFRMLRARPAAQAAAAVATALALSGCPETPAGDTDAGMTCRLASDCPEDHYCSDDDVCVAGLPPGTCEDESDCGEGELCVIPTGGTIGACVNQHACDIDADCGDPDKVCEDANNDGFRDCVFDGCENDAECQEELSGQCGDTETARCVARACVCQDYCGVPCGEGTVCCADSASPTCIDDVGACGAMACPAGFAGATDVPSTWTPTDCSYNAVGCECRELPPLPAGLNGAPHVLREDPAGTVWAIAYNVTYGDVTIAAVSGSDTGGQDVGPFQHVLGVPALSAEAPIVAGPSGPRSGIEAAGDDVGRMLDAAFAADGTLHIAARDATAGALVWAHGSIESGLTAVAIDTDGDAGYWPQIEILNDRVVIAASARAPAQNRAETRLFVAGETGNAPSTFQRTVLSQRDLTGVSCRGGCADGEVCTEGPTLPDDTTGPGVCVAEGADCGCMGSDVCTLTGCVAAGTPATAATAHALSQLDMVVFANDVSIFAHNPQSGTLDMLRRTGGTLFANPVFTQNTVVAEAGEVVGTHPSAVAVPVSGFGVVYSSPSKREIAYTLVGPTGTTTLTHVVDDGLRPHPSGAQDDHMVDQPSIARAADGRGIIVWQDGTDGALLARRLSNVGALGSTVTLAPGLADASYAGHVGFDTGAIFTDAPTATAQRVNLGEDAPSSLVAFPVP